MGQQYRIDDEEEELDEEMTAGELKEMREDVDANDNMVTVTTPEGESMALDDDEEIGNAPEGSDISFLPAKGNVYGN